MMIQTTALTKYYGEFAAVRELTISAAPSEILGFLGPNGAGKSTTVKMLTGMMKPSSGTASIAGYDVHVQPLEAKKRLGYVPETGALYESLTPSAFLEFVAGLYHMDSVSATVRANEMFELFDLTAARNKRLSELSKGMKQKVLIASALIHNPDVLFLDEPLNGLDPNSALVMKEILRKLASHGKTIFLCSHILEIVERICTRIIIIDKGVVAAQGTAADICRETETETLEQAFCKVTGVRSAGDVSRDFIEALERE
jgi:ABC-2 type transport system ATP-binding protein